MLSAPSNAINCVQFICVIRREMSCLAASGLILTAICGLVGCGQSSNDHARQPFPSGVVADSITADTSAEPPPGDPVFTTDKRSADLGELPRNAVARCRFLILNDSSLPFTILDYRKSCSCEAASIDIGRSVQPGDRLEVEYALSRYGGGAKQGRLIIETDSEQSSLKTIQLDLQAQSPRVLWATPAALAFQSGEGEAALVKRLVLNSDVPELFANPVEITALRGLVDVEVVERKTDQLILDVRQKAARSEANAFDLIRVVVDDGLQTSLTVRVRSSRKRDILPLQKTSKALANSATDRL